MKSTKKTDVFNLISRLQKILTQKPSQEEMLKEVQMMKFKIRPVYGDLSLLDFKNLPLVEALWGLGKIEEFFYKEVKKIDGRDQQTFFRLINQIKNRLETQLNKISFKTSVTVPQMVEMEIFKERPRKKN